MLYFVFLRRPVGLDDRRDDPFWEFGSFGRTGCHRNNLMHPVRTPLCNGDRLAFLQGGRGEIRMTGLTPPIKMMPTAEGIEARWDKNFRPFQFVDAPLLIDNSGNTDFRGIRAELDGTRRSTYCGAAASRFRSRKRHIDDPLASEIIKRFAAWEGTPAKVYLDAIEADGGAWHREGISQDWGAKYVRESRFLTCVGISVEEVDARLKPCCPGPRKLVTTERKRRC